MLSLGPKEQLFVGRCYWNLDTWAGCPYLLRPAQEAHQDQGQLGLEEKGSLGTVEVGGAQEFLI